MLSSRVPGLVLFGFSCGGCGGDGDLLQLVLEAAAPVGSQHQTTYLRTERLAASVGGLGWFFFLVSTSPFMSGEFVEPNSCVGFLVELVVCPGRLDELFPVVQEDCLYIG